MKKILMLLSLIVVVMFSACKEPEPPQGGEGTGGGETPQEKVKIAKIYVDYSNGSGKQLSEVWTWDKDQLKKIEYYHENYDNGNLELWYEQYFTYNDKGLVTRVDEFTHDLYVEYSYDSNNKLTKARMYEDDELSEDWKFTYDGDKISRIDLVYEAKSSMKTNINPISIILPFESADYVCDLMRDNALKSRNGFYVELTWDKDNISKMEGVEDGDRAVIDFKYDNKLNPFNDIWGTSVEDYFEDCYGSKNNVTQAVYTYYEDGESDNEVINYSYNYDGDYPIVKKEIGGSTWYYEYQ